MLSSSTGNYLGSGIVLTQRDNLVHVRNPPRPPVKENEVTVTVDDETSTTNEEKFRKIWQIEKRWWMGKSDKKKKNAERGQQKAKSHLVQQQKRKK